MKRNISTALFVCIVLIIVFFGTLEDKNNTGITVSEPTQILSGSSFFSFKDIDGILVSTPDKKSRATRKSLMNQNSEYIKGWLYDLTFREAKSFLKNTSKSVPIDLIMENQKYRQYANDFQYWKDYYAGDDVDLYKDQKLGVNFTHAKAFVGDTYWVIQTANLSYGAFHKNKETFFFSQDTEIRDDLLALWDIDQTIILNNGKNKKKQYTDWVNDSSQNLVVCPLNCRDKIEQLINTAESSIRISQQYVTDDRLLDILSQRSGIDIQVITNDTDTNYELFELLGPEQVELRKSPYSHDKMMIIDEKILLVGSMNFSSNALDNNREIGILTTNSKLVDQALKFFR